jgi:phosphatidylglycerol lysyltransferase
MRRFNARPLLALAVAAMGAVDLLSALLSHPPERVLALRHLVPTDVLDTSRTFTLLAGALLLLTANGLRRGKRRAFVTALFLCALSVPVNLLKAGDLEEATTAAALMFMLGLNAQAFVVKSREMSWRSLRGPAVATVLAIGLYALGGCWLLEWTYGTRTASFARAVQEAIYQMFGVGEPALAVTRAQHFVRWYLGSISVLGLTLLVGFVAAMLKPARHLGRHRADAQRVRDLVRVHGDSTVAAFALDDDVDWFFSDNGRAVIAYRYESDVLLVIGDPIGPPEETPSLLESFERFCRQHDWTFAFYQARPERLALYRARGWRAVHVGEDPVLWTEPFSLEGPAIGVVRRAVRKLERAGLEVRHFVPGRTVFRDAADHARLLEALREISTEWLHGRDGGEKGFCMGRFDPAGLDDVWLAIAWAPATGRVEAFCTWTPVWARRGWALDLVRRRPEAPTGVMELLVTRSVEQARLQGDLMMSLSLSALVKVDAVTGEPDSTPSGDPARAFLIERLSRFYDFQGLFRWKRKFAPVFEDRFLVFADPLALPRIALALVRAQTPGGLLSFVRSTPVLHTAKANRGTAAA